MDSPLHQDASPIHFNSFRNLLVNLLEIENIAFFGLRSLQRPVKRAECAVFRAEIGVVDGPVNDVGDDGFGVEAPANRVCIKAQADQVRGVEVIESLLAGQRHGSILPILRLITSVWGRLWRCGGSPASFGTGTFPPPPPAPRASPRGSRPWRPRRTKPKKPQNPSRNPSLPP